MVSLSLFVTDLHRRRPHARRREAGAFLQIIGGAKNGVKGWSPFSPPSHHLQLSRWQASKNFLPATLAFPPAPERSEELPI